MNYLASSFIFLTLLGACISNTAQQKGSTQTISVAEFQRLLNAGKKVQLLDVRTPEEYKEDHLPNSVNINFNAPDFKEKVAALDKSSETFVYCLSGGRSNGAMNALSEMGFEKVYNMKGGILQWRAAALPLQKSSASPAGWKGMSKDEYKEMISGDIPVVIDFNAAWCGPCKQLKPILEEIQKEHAGKIKIIPIDIDAHKSLAQSMFVNNIPLLIYHEKGQPVANQEGFLDKEGLLKLFKLK